jgi:hypothetical protein
VGGSNPVNKYSELGPTYINLRGNVFRNRYITCGDGDEVFDPRRTTIRASLSTYTSPTSTTTSGYFTSYRDQYGRYRGYWTTTVITYFGTFTVTTDVRDMQKATFPRTLVLSRNYFCHEYYGCYGGDPRPRDVPYYFEKHYFDLAYIKVVDLWNTTNVLAYVDGRNSNTVALRVDRPIGIAAVYVYSRTEARLPPPPPPPIHPPEGCVEGANICGSFDSNLVPRTSSTKEAHPTGQCDGQVTVTFENHGGSDCGVWVAPGPGTYTGDQLQRCPENNGQITCTVPAGSTLIHGCARRRS